MNPTPPVTRTRFAGTDIDILPRGQIQEPGIPLLSKRRKMHFVGLDVDWQANASRAEDTQMQVEKIALGDWLKSEARQQTIHWYPNPGHAGDSLIAAATAQFFRKEGLAFETICDPGNFDSRGKFVCYGGGGNLIPHYEKARWFLQKHHERAGRLIVLPHSVQGNEDLLGSLSPNVTIVCREPVSFAHCRAAAPRAEVLVADDLALGLTPRYLAAWRLFPSVLAERQAHAAYRQIFRRFVEEFRGVTELTSWRSGPEWHPSRKEPPQGDVSKTFGLDAIGTKSRARSLDKFKLSAHFFLRAIDQFSRIRTDRLHVAIGGAILGKDVELYPNAYYKNRAVYEFSLNSLPNVRFKDWD